MDFARIRERAGPRGKLVRGTYGGKPEPQVQQMGHSTIRLGDLILGERCKWRAAVDLGRSAPPQGGGL